MDKRCSRPEKPCLDRVRADIYSGRPRRTMTDTPPPRRTPSAAQAALVYIAVFVLNFGLAIALGAVNVSDNVVLLVSPAVVLAIPVVAAALFGLSFKDTFLLRLPRLTDVFMAVPLAFSYVVLSDQLSTITARVVPIAAEFQEEMARLIAVDGVLEWIVKLIGIGFGAAVSEELLFRGFILTGLLAVMPRPTAIVFTAVLFAILHIIPLPSIFLGGIILAVSALGSRSILVPILIHFLNNASALVLFNVGNVETLAEPLWVPPGILIPAILIFGLTIGYYVRRFPESDETKRRPVQETAPPVRAARTAQPTLSDELREVPAGRRRLGWLIVAVSLLVGFVIFVVLWVWMGLMAYGQADLRGNVQAAGIAYMKDGSRRLLSESASPRASEVDGAFEALARVNEAGGLDFETFQQLLQTFLAAGADGAIDPGEVDRLIGEIRVVVTRGAAPRRL